MKATRFLYPSLSLIIVLNSWIHAYDPQFMPISTGSADPIHSSNSSKNVSFMPTKNPYSITQPKSSPELNGSAAYTEYRKTAPTSQPVVETAEELFSRATEVLRSGDIDGAINLYKKSISLDNGIPQTHFNMGVALMTQEKIDEAAAAFNKAIALKPDYAKAHLQLGKILKNKGLARQAIDHLNRACEIDPSMLEAHQLAATLCTEEHRFDEGIAHLRKVVEAKPDDINALFSLANALNTANHTQEALDLYYKVLERNPESPAILYNIAYTLKKLNRLADSMPFYKKVLEKDPNHASAHFSYGLACLITGDFETGWKEYEWRWQQEKGQLSPREYGPMWDGSDLHGKTIYLHAEQGLGDTFQFIRYAQLVKQRGAAKVIVAVQQPLKDIISLCPYIDQVIRLNDPKPTFDTHAPLVSLPYIFKTRIDTVPTNIPYLFAKQDLIEQWRKKLGGDTNFKVGICYQGNDKYSTSFLRAVVKAKSMPLATLTPLSTISGVSIYNLQKETGTDQLKTPPFSLITFDGDFDNSNGRFMDTAAIIKNLDLVITIDTSIGHFAAALGTPTWIMLPNPPDWRWLLDRSDTPWYPNVRLFRQPTPGDWDSPVADIVRELNMLVSKKNTGMTPFEASKVAAAIHRSTESGQLSHSSMAMPEELDQLVDELSDITMKMYKAGASIQTMHCDSPLDPEFVDCVRNFYILSQKRSLVKEKMNTIMRSVKTAC